MFWAKCPTWWALPLCSGPIAPRGGLYPRVLGPMPHVVGANTVFWAQCPSATLSFTPVVKAPQLPAVVVQHARRCRHGIKQPNPLQPVFRQEAASHPV